MTTTVVPPIKSQGIKTALVPWIRSLVPERFRGRFIEPFMGTGVVGLNVAPGRALLSDANPHLVRFYAAVNSGSVTVEKARRHLEREGRRLAEIGEDHFYAVRDRFNRRGAPLDFLFLSRAAFNGMMRFNRRGGFNVPFCRKPERFAKAYVTKIVNQLAAVTEILRSRRFEFLHRDFEEAIADVRKGDLLYCDPPYLGRHADYFSLWDEARERALWDALARCRGRFILSTWHSNAHRRNAALAAHASTFRVLLREHFYHVGAREVNRGPVIEALVTNIE